MDPRSEALDKLIAFARKLMVQQRGGDKAPDALTEALAPDSGGDDSAPQDVADEGGDSGKCPLCGADMHEGDCADAEQPSGAGITIVKAGKIGGDRPKFGGSKMPVPKKKFPGAF